MEKTELDKAIEHCYDVIETCTEKECTNEHLQLASWLSELRSLRHIKSRWIQINRTTPSGKTLFVCKSCGRVSPTPDKNCKTWDDPDETWNCSEKG